MNTPDTAPATDRDDLPHDAHLRAALRNAPDLDLLPPAALSARILAQASQAVATQAAAPMGPAPGSSPMPFPPHASAHQAAPAPSPAPPGRPKGGLVGWLDKLLRPPVVAAFAGMVLATALLVTQREAPPISPAAEAPAAPAQTIAAAPQPGRDAAAPPAGVAVPATPAGPNAALPAAPKPATTAAAARQSDLARAAAQLPDQVALAERAGAAQDESLRRGGAGPERKDKATEALADVVLADAAEPPAMAQASPQRAEVAVSVAAAGVAAGVASPAPAPLGTSATTTTLAAAVPPPSVAAAPPALVAARAAAPAPALAKAVTVPADADADPLAAALAAFVPRPQRYAADADAEITSQQPAPAWLAELREATRGRWQSAAPAQPPAYALRGPDGRLLGRVGVSGGEVVWQLPDGTQSWRAAAPDAAARLSQQLETTPAATAAP